MPPDTERGRPGDHSGDAPNTTAGQTTHSVREGCDVRAWVAEQTAARTARSERRRGWLRQAQAEHDRARAYGLKASHPAADQVAEAMRRVVSDETTAARRIRLHHTFVRRRRFSRALDRWCVDFYGPELAAEYGIYDDRDDGRAEHCPCCVYAGVPR
jgi:hypothetical protein